MWIAASLFWTVFCAAALLFGLFLLLRRGRRLKGLVLALAAVPVWMAGSLFLLNADARQKGWQDNAERMRAHEAGVIAPEGWADQRAAGLAAAQAETEAAAAAATKAKAERDALAARATAERAAKDEADRKAVEARAAQRHAEEVAAKAAADAEEVAAKAAADAEEAERRRLGRHCVYFDGAFPEFERLILAQLRDPDSYERIETRVGPVEQDGGHVIALKYRARNGFGGMNVSEAIGTFANADCAPKLLSAE